jgi:hypothetical protein
MAPVAQLPPLFPAHICPGLPGQARVACCPLAVGSLCMPGAAPATPPRVMTRPCLVALTLVSLAWSYHGSGSSIATCESSTSCPGCTAGEADSGAGWGAPTQAHQTAVPPNWGPEAAPLWHLGRLEPCQAGASQWPSMPATRQRNLPAAGAEAAEQLPTSGADARRSCAAGPHEAEPFSCAFHVSFCLLDSGTSILGGGTS